MSERLIGPIIKASQLKDRQLFALVIEGDTPSVSTVYMALKTHIPGLDDVIGIKVGKSANKWAPKIIVPTRFGTGQVATIINEG